MFSYDVQTWSYNCFSWLNLHAYREMFEIKSGPEAIEAGNETKRTAQVNKTGSHSVLTHTGPAGVGRFSSRVTSQVNVGYPQSEYCGEGEPHMVRDIATRVRFGLYCCICWSFTAALGRRENGMVYQWHCCIAGHLAVVALGQYDKQIHTCTRLYYGTRPSEFDRDWSEMSYCCLTTDPSRRYDRTVNRNEIT